MAELKASAFKNARRKRYSYYPDTVVWHNNESLAKAATIEEARLMLQKLSGSWREVITSVSVTAINAQHTFSSNTRVKFTPYLRKKSIIILHSINHLIRLVLMAFKNG